MEDVKLLIAKRKERGYLMTRDIWLQEEQKTVLIQMTPVKCAVEQNLCEKVSLANESTI